MKTCKKGHPVPELPSIALNTYECGTCGAGLHPVTRNDLDHPPSEEFERAISHTGSIHVSCELCGRVHFATASPGYFDDGELEQLRKNAEADPIKYVEDGNSDSISWGTINGKQAVIGCPCNILSNFENFIWQHREIIASFLKAKTAKRLENAVRDVKTSETIAESVKKAGNE